MKSVLNSLTVYWIFVFLLPSGMIHEINRLYLNFLWNGPDVTTLHALLSYYDMCFLYEEGGLGLRDLETVNWTAMMRNL